MATTQTIRIIVEEKGSKQAAKNIKEVGEAASASQQALDLLRGAFGSVGVAAIVREYVSLSNTYQTLQNRLKLVTSGQQEQAAISKELLAIANQTFTSLEATTELYARLAFNTRELGISQQDVLDVTKSLNQAVILSGAGIREATNAIIQLSQGLASGTLRGDELRSVLEQLPFVAEVVSRGLGVTRDQLRRLAIDGKVTTQAIVSALQSAAPEIQAKFDQITPTIAQAFQVLNNNLLDFVGNANEATGLSAVLANTLIFLGKNIEIVVVAVGLLGAALTALALKAIIAGVSSLVAEILSATIVVKGLSAAVAILNVVLAVNPFILIAAAIAGVIALLIGLDSIVNDTTESTMKLNEQVGGFNTEAVSKSLAGYVRIRDELLRQQDILDRQLATSVLQEKQEDEVYKLGQKILKDQITLTESQRGELDLLVKQNVELKIRNDLTQKAIDKQRDLQDEIRQGLRNKGVQRAQDVAVAPLVNARLEAGLPFDQDFQKRLQAIRDSVALLNQIEFRENVEKQNRDLRDSIDLLNTSVELRQREAAVQKVVNDAQERGVTNIQQSVDATRRLFDELRFASIEDAIQKETDSLVKSNEVASLRLQNREAEADVQEFLNGILARGESIESRGLDLLKEQVRLRQQIAQGQLEVDFNRQLDEQQRLLDTATTQRQTETTIIQRRNDYLKIGLDYTAEQEQFDRQRLQLLDEQTRRQQIQNEVFGDRVANEQRLRDLQDVRNATTSPADRRGLERAIAEQRIAGRQGDPTLVAGFENGLDRLFLKVSDVAGGIEEALTNAFSSAEDALVQFVQTGEFNFSGLVDSILADVTRLLARQAILLLFNAVSGGTSGAFGGVLSALTGARADGGPVRPGQSFLVGERGPEIFQPSQPGTIIPNGSTPQAPAANITVVNVLDPSMITDALNSPQGQQIIVNTIGRNRQAVNRQLGTR